MGVRGARAALWPLPSSLPPPPMEELLALFNVDHAPAVDCSEFDPQGELNRTYSVANSFPCFLEALRPEAAQTHSSLLPATHALAPKHHAPRSSSRVPSGAVSVTRQPWLISSRDESTWNFALEDFRSRSTDRTRELGCTRTRGTRGCGDPGFPDLPQPRRHARGSDAGTESSGARTFLPEMSRVGFG